MIFMYFGVLGLVVFCCSMFVFWELKKIGVSMVKMCFDLFLNVFVVEFLKDVYKLLEENLKKVLKNLLSLFL